MVDSARIQVVDEAIRERRSVFPPQYNGRKIDEETIKEILQNANWAPTHKLTEPWRFKVLTGSATHRLGEWMAEKYKESNGGNQFLEKKYEKLKSNPQKAAAIILICMQRDPEGRLPEWEELASVAMAVQNMWLSCHTRGIGAYWSSPPMIEHMGQFIPMENGEKCYGLFYMGYCDENLPTAARNSIDDKVTWLAE